MAESLLAVLRYLANLAAIVAQGFAWLIQADCFGIDEAAAAPHESPGHPPQADISS